MARLGYACLNTTLENRSRTTTEKKIKELGKKAESVLQALTVANLEEVLQVLAWNEAKGIKFFRLSSSLFPHMGNTNFRGKYFGGDIEFARSVLRKIGDFASKHGHRLTFHAQPYIQLGTPTKVVWEKSLFDILMHHKIFKTMGLVPGPFNCLIVHGGGVYEGKQATLERIAVRLKSLPPSVRRMIVFENDEWHYTPNDLLPLCEKFKLGFCFDVFHNSIHVEPQPLTKAFLKRVLDTWPSRADVKMHISEQQPHVRKGSHADMVRQIPSWMLALKPWLMIEAKKKEIAVLFLKKKYKL